MILLIDNYDSFVYNLARYIGMLGRERKVCRNDALSLDDIEAMKPEGIILSPGPCTPKESGISVDLIRRFGAHIPILGVCLGHQCIAEAYGGRTVRAPHPVHGRTSTIEHNGHGLFLGLPSPMDVARYHSLTVELPSSDSLSITAMSDDGVIMALRHCRFPVYGVQFHPESALTDNGLDIIRNFITLAMQWHEGTDSICR